VQDLRDALAINPRRSILYVHLAKAYQMSGNQGEARKALQRAEELGIKPESLDPLERGIIDKLRQDLALLGQAGASAGAK